MNKVRTRRRNTSKNRKKRNTRNNRNTRNTRKRKVSTKRRRVKSKRRASSFKGGSAFCSARPKSDGGWRGPTVAQKIKSTRKESKRRYGGIHSKEYYQYIINELTEFSKAYMEHQGVGEDDIMSSAKPVRDFILAIDGKITHYQVKKASADRHPSQSAASARGTGVRQQSA